MDPNTGKIYDLSDPTIPDDVRARLVPVPEDPKAAEELRAAMKKAMLKELVDTETQELGEILDEYEEIKTMPNLPEEKFYPINRAARRTAEKRDRALRKRDKRG